MVELKIAINQGMNPDQKIKVQGGNLEPTRLGSGLIRDSHPTT